MYCNLEVKVAESEADICQVAKNNKILMIFLWNIYEFLLISLWTWYKIINSCQMAIGSEWDF
jgi:hypothetical protein